MNRIGGRAPRLDHARGGASAAARTFWEVAAWEIAHLGSCHMGKENAFGKVPNIFFTTKAKNCFIALKCTCLLSRALNKVLET